MNAACRGTSAPASVKKRPSALQVHATTDYNRSSEGSLCYGSRGHTKRSPVIDFKTHDADWPDAEQLGAESATIRRRRPSTAPPRGRVLPASSDATDRPTPARR